MNQKVARGALEKMRCTVDIVNNGAEAVDAWSAGSYDLILMDCQMPVMDGYQATRTIRSREQAGTRIPILALTADAMSGAAQDCLTAGMDGYLTKPLDRKRLAESIERLLGRGCAARLPRAGAPRRASPDPVDWEQFVSVTDGDGEFARQLVQLFIDSGDAALARDPRRAGPRGLAGGRPGSPFVQRVERQHARAGGERCGRALGASRAGR